MVQVNCIIGISTLRKATIWKPMVQLSHAVVCCFFVCCLFGFLFVCLFTCLFFGVIEHLAMGHQGNGQVFSEQKSKTSICH